MGVNLLPSRENTYSPVEEATALLLLSELDAALEAEQSIPERLGEHVPTSPQIRDAAHKVILTSTAATALVTGVGATEAIASPGRHNVAITATATTTSPDKPMSEGTVVSGDTLEGIAQKHHETLGQLLKDNPQFQADPGLIHPGEKVYFPQDPAPAAPSVAAPATPGRALSPEAAQSGDTLDGIAHEHHETLGQLLQDNPKYQKNPRLIHPGDVIMVPGSAPAPAAPAAQPAAPQRNLAGEAITKGDTLNEIATEHHETLGQLIQDNPQFAQDPGRIYPGQIVQVPKDTAPAPAQQPAAPATPPAAPATHPEVMQPGSVWQQGQERGYTIQQWEQANPGVDPGHVQAGKNYNIPNTAKPITPSAPQPKSATPEQPSQTPSAHVETAPQGLWDGELESKVEANYPIYKKVQDQTGVPWQLLAVVHLREHALSTSNPSNGQGIYQFWDKHGGPYPSGEVSQAEFERQTLLAAQFLIGKAGNQADMLTKQPLDMNSQAYTEMIKTVLAKYNGLPDLYRQQAKALGFNPDTQAAEGSPYVMNLADDKRNSKLNPNWKQYLSDGGNVGPANMVPGAYLYFDQLVILSQSDAKLQPPKPQPATPPATQPAQPTAPESTPPASQAPALAPSAPSTPAPAPSEAPSTPASPSTTPDAPAQSATPSPAPSTPSASAAPVAPQAPTAPADPNPADYPPVADKNGMTNVPTTIHGLPYESQHNAAWSGKAYGSHGTIGEAGCEPSSFSEAKETLTGIDDTPEQEANWNAAHGFRAESGTYGAAIPAAAAAAGLPTKKLTSADQIRQELAKNSGPDGIQVVIVMDGKDNIANTSPTPTGHFFELVGLDSNGKALVNDPNSVGRSLVPQDVDELFASSVQRDTGSIYAIYKN